MTKKLAHLRFLASSWGLASAMTACSSAIDPSKQEPVDPQAGLYEITLSTALARGILPAASAAKSDQTYCLRESGRGSFAHKLAQKYYQTHGACQTKQAPRKGNAVAGEIECLADQKMASGANRFSYKGVVADDRVNLDFKINFDASIKDSLSDAEKTHLQRGMKMLEKARFGIQAKRIGDC